MIVRNLPAALAITLAAFFVFAPGARAGEDEADFLGGIQFAKNAARWEVRAGAGVYDEGPFTTDTFKGTTVNFEVLAPSPDWLSAIGSPRPYLGADIALSDDPIQAVYAGLNWEAYLTGRFYLGFSAGGAILSDDQVANAAGEVRDLGAPVLFHLQASAGFDFTPDIGAQVYLNHFSNAFLVDQNDGLESMGARLAVRF